MRILPAPAPAPVSEDRYRSVVDNSPYGIYRVTFDGSFVTVNPALCAMVGYSAEELFASNIVVLYPTPPSASGGSTTTSSGRRARRSNCSGSGRTGS